MTDPTAPTTRSQRNDLSAALVTGPAIAVIAVIVAIWRLQDLFTPDGIRTSLPLDPNTATVVLTESGAQLTGEATAVTVVAAGVPLISVAALVLSILVNAGIWIAAAAALVILAREIGAGRAFDRRARRTLTTTSWVILGGISIVMAADLLGRNGVAAALGDGVELQTSYALMVPYVVAWAIAFAIGILAIAFARGAHLERETRGLV